MKAAQFFRFFCRFTVVLVRATDTDLFAAVEARKMIIPVYVHDAPELLRKKLGARS